MRLLLLDNYDSFTWNLAQYLRELGAETAVELNDRVSVDWVAEQRFDALVISPGPGRPAEAGISLGGPIVVGVFVDKDIPTFLDNIDAERASASRRD